MMSEYNTLQLPIEFRSLNTSQAATIMTISLRKRVWLLLWIKVIDNNNNRLPSHRIGLWRNKSQNVLSRPVATALNIVSLWYGLGQKIASDRTQFCQCIFAERCEISDRKLSMRSIQIAGRASKVFDMAQQRQQQQVAANCLENIYIYGCSIPRTNQCTWFSAYADRPRSTSSSRHWFAMNFIIAQVSLNLINPYQRTKNCVPYLSCNERRTKRSHTQSGAFP